MAEEKQPVEPTEPVEPTVKAPPPDTSWLKTKRVKGGSQCKPRRRGQG